MFSIQTFQSLIVASAILVPIVTGVTEVIKRAFSFPDRFVPLLAVILGLGASLAVIQLSLVGALVGIVIGLGSVGLWNFHDTTVQGN